MEGWDADLSPCNFVTTHCPCGPWTGGPFRNAPKFVEIIVGIACCRVGDWDRRREHVLNARGGTRPESCFSGAWTLDPQAEDNPQNLCIKGQIQRPPENPKFSPPPPIFEGLTPPLSRSLLRGNPQKKKIVGPDVMQSGFGVIFLFLSGEI